MQIAFLRLVMPMMQTGHRLDSRAAQARSTKGIKISHSILYLFVSPESRQGACHFRKSTIFLANVEANFTADRSTTTQNEKNKTGKSDGRVRHFCKQCCPCWVPVGKEKSSMVAPSLAVPGAACIALPASGDAPP